MNESDTARLDPHKNGLFAGCLLGGASAIFALIAIGIMLSGNTSLRTNSSFPPRKARRASPPFRKDLILKFAANQGVGT